MKARHGEYKTPGGKLVVVDLSAGDGVLRDVMVSGDFFLYPEEALEEIAASLDGAPLALTDAELAGRIRDSLPDGAEMMGFSPEAIVIAIRRALA
jgi:lipoate-protein ligase A